MIRSISKLAALCAVLGLAAPAAPAFAATTADIAPAFANTIVSTYPDGRKARLWLNKDGSYRAAGRRGKPSSGLWTLKGERICLKQLKPSKAPFSFCTEVKSGGVGASWPSKAVTGEKITVTVVAGR